MNASTEQPARPSRSLVATNHLYLLVVVTLATTLMLQSMRVFTSYMVFVIDQSNRVELAVTVFGTFLAIGLGGLLLRTVRFRRTLLIGAFVFGASRLAFQFWELPEARLLLGAVALVAWGWLMLAVLRHWRETTAIGVGFGLALDLLIRIAFTTRDLPWNPGPVEHLVSVVLVVGMLVGVSGIRGLHIQQLPEYSTRRVWSLMAFGPGIALYHVVTGNLGMAQESAGMVFPEAALLLALGTAIGLRLSLFAAQMIGSPPGGRVQTGPLLVAIVLAIGLFLIGQGGVAAVPGFVLAPAAGLLLLTFAVSGRESEAEVEPPLTWLTIAFTGGLLLQVGLLFVYYMYSGMPLFLGIIAASFVLLAIQAGIPDISRPIHQPKTVLVGAGVVAGALALVSGWQLLTWEQVEAQPVGGPEITVMTYNIQNGFDLDNRYDLEAIAGTILDEDPDVVVIQEIPRGWLVTSNVDQVTVLGDLLDMPYVYGPNSDDGMWGNAIFTRLPIAESRTTQFTETQNLKRGAIEIQIETEAGPIWIYGTHLDNPIGAGDMRLLQARELIEFRDGQQPALVLGDLNVLPDDPVMDQFAEAGLRDFGLELPDGARTSPNRGRIDYILGTDDLELLDIHITEVWTSDHLPVIATVRVAD